MSLCACGHDFTDHYQTDVEYLCLLCSWCEGYTKAAANDSATAPVPAGGTPEGLAREKVEMTDSEVKPSSPVHVCCEGQPRAGDASESPPTDEHEHCACWDTGGPCCLLHGDASESGQHPYNGGTCCDQPLVDHAYADAKWVAQQDWYGPVESGQPPEDQFSSEVREYWRTHPDPSGQPPEARDE